MENIESKALIPSKFSEADVPVVIDRLDEALSTATTVQDHTRLDRIIRAVKELVRKSNMSFGAQFAFATRYIINRRLRGKILMRAVKDGKIDKGGNIKGSNRSQRVTGKKTTLKELGVTKNESSCDQKIATLTDKQFDKLIVEIREKSQREVELEEKLALACRGQGISPPATHGG